jgi:hypothetical protein
MIHVSDAECLPLANGRIANGTRRVTGIDFGSKDNESRDMLGVRGEIAFCKHLDSKGIEYEHTGNTFNMPDVFVFHQGKTYPVDVKTIPVFGPSGRPCRFLFRTEPIIQKLINLGWIIVAAAVRKDRVWISKAKRPQDLTWTKPNHINLPNRPDLHLCRCCSIESFDWHGQTWGDIVREASA